MALAWKTLGLCGKGQGLAHSRGRALLIVFHFQRWIFVSKMELTVAEVSGLIAAGVFLLQVLIPLAIPWALIAFLSNEHSILTWSVELFLCVACLTIV